MSEYSPGEGGRGLTFSSAGDGIEFGWAGFAAAVAVNFIKVHNCMGLVALEIVLRFLSPSSSSSGLA